MSVQAQKLVSRLKNEGLAVEFLATNPSSGRLIQRIPGLRTLVQLAQFKFKLLGAVIRNGVVHHLGASGLFFFVRSAPVLIWGKLLRRRVILNYRGGKADEFLKSWGWLAVPIMRLADHLLVPSAFLQRVFSGYGLKAEILPNIADLEHFSFRVRTSFRPRLLVTRQLEPMYNLPCVLRAFRRIRETEPEAVLGIAGSGSEEAKLRAMVEEWKLEGVTFYGAVANRELPALYDQYDFLINASNVDNFPGALVEAACAGLLIVSTEAGGIPDMVKHGETALLAKLDDDAALANEVLRMVKDQPAAREIAQRANAWVQQYAWSNVYRELTRYYGFEAAAEMQPSQPERVALAGAKDR